MCCSLPGTVAAGASHPAWSPSGAQIAYESVSLVANYESGLVTMMNADGSEPHEVSPGTGPISWFADGRRLLVISFGSPFQGQSSGPAPAEGVAVVSAQGGLASSVPINGSQASVIGVQQPTPVRALQAPPVVGASSTPSGAGYWDVAADGGVFSHGDAQFYGSMGGRPLTEPVVGMAASNDGGGYWLAATDGGIFPFGDANYYGSMGGRPLNQPIAGVAADRATGGYWEVAADGGIFSFGAPCYGSMGGRALNQPIVGMAATDDGGGYWLVARDGGVFAFGDAQSAGSMGGVALNKPVTGMAANPDGPGYWLVGADGGVFSFGGVAFKGTPTPYGSHLSQPVVALVPGQATGGYREITTGGGLFDFSASARPRSLPGMAMRRRRTTSS